MVEHSAAALSSSVAQEREALQRSKQIELSQILSRHDDLVREQFHLDRYKLLGYFDYEVAKADQSEAWQKFVQENGHDLLQNMPVASSSTLGLATRRARQKATAVLQPTPPATTTTSTPLPETRTHTLKRQRAVDNRRGAESSSSLKRIRLIVRTPEPHYSSPAQKPAPLAFGGSLDSALPAFPATDNLEECEGARDEEPRTPWESLLLEIRLKREGCEPGHGFRVSAHIASQVQEYWKQVVQKSQEQKLEHPHGISSTPLLLGSHVASCSITQPALFRGALRSYQQAGLEWLVGLYTKNLNGILADEMGLGKTIQTISLFAHLAQNYGMWGPHLIIVPTSVIVNWEMEFKRFLPSMRVVAYHGTSERRKQLRLGWSNQLAFNICITSYDLAVRDERIFKRREWQYLVLDEAHLVKNFRSQRWGTLLAFKSSRRLLLTGTPLQNNLTELWAILQFIVPETDHTSLKEFSEWFADPLEKAIEKGTHNEEETLQRVMQLHTMLRPYMLRRLKCDVEKDLPSKHEHLVLCSLSTRQRLLYDNFISRASTRAALLSGKYQEIANVLMELRKVCNHPDLFEQRPVRTSFAIHPAAIADLGIKEFSVRRRLLQTTSPEHTNIALLRLHFSAFHDTSEVAAARIKQLDGTEHLPFDRELGALPPPSDTRTIDGFKRYREYQQRASSVARWANIAYTNRSRCAREPVISSELIRSVGRMCSILLPASNLDFRRDDSNPVLAVNKAIRSYEERAEMMAPFVDRFAFLTLTAVVPSLSHYAFGDAKNHIVARYSSPLFDAPLHRAAVKLQIEFPERDMLQYDCGKLQRLADLLKTCRAGGHRVLVFTQMKRVLDILEEFLTFHGLLYLRLDGSTKVEDRHYLTELFNSDPKIFCFIASSRAGGTGINLTGADTVIFYDSDYNPQLDRQCEDRAHRIGQTRDVHIYRFVSKDTVEEAMLLKINQKRSLNELVIQKGGFDWNALLDDELVSELQKPVGEEPAEAAQATAQVVGEVERADWADFREEREVVEMLDGGLASNAQGDRKRSTADYMLDFVQRDPEHFAKWRA